MFELETQIRNLGGDYACFGLLYWNIGKDVDDYDGNYDSYSIFNSGLGGRGNSNANYCVTNGNFRRGVYTPYYCPASWASLGQCCLRRFTATNSGSTSLYESWQSEAAILESSAYVITKDEIEYGPHGVARM